VLVADNNRDSADALTMLLRDWGYESASVYDGAATLAAAQTFRPDVCLIDWDMPGQSGLAVAQRLRAQAGRRPLVLFAVTAGADARTCEHLTAEGFDHVYAKPVNQAALSAALRLLCQTLRTLGDQAQANAGRAQELLTLTLELVRQGRLEVDKARQALGRAPRNGAGA
jgi:CheY-like chemotaxis protein